MAPGIRLRPAITLAALRLAAPQADALEPASTGVAAAWLKALP
ncbi:hypothetical protein [Magnetospirillum sp. UT-4]|nr:hypothetical protein [Magnetospirillum sp. UT-4]